MHPVNKHTYGTTGIGVIFRDGTGLHNGYIVKQLSNKRFKVAATGVPPVVMKLVSTLAEATSLPVGKMNILLDNGEHIVRMHSKHVITAEGHRFIWAIGSAKNGSKFIARYVP